MGQIKQQDGIIVAELDPSYDALSGSQLRELNDSLLAAVAQQPDARLLLDMHRTTYIGSGFLEVLVRVWKRLRETEGQMAICSANADCLEVFRVTNLEKLWGIYADRQEAEAALQQ